MHYLSVRDRLLVGAAWEVVGFDLDRAISLLDLLAIAGGGSGGLQRRRFLLGLAGGDLAWSRLELLHLLADHVVDGGHSDLGGAEALVREISVLDGGVTQEVHEGVHQVDDGWELAVLVLLDGLEERGEAAPDPVDLLRLELLLQELGRGVYLLRHVQLVLSFKND